MIETFKYPLRDLHTFGVEAFAESLIRVQSEEDLSQALPKLQSKPLLIIGGGSNLLFTQDYKGLILKNEILGKSIEYLDEDTALVQVKAGENWHELVMWCVDQGLGGIENLALIPGSVGAAPIQNIGAYGVELKDSFHSLEAIFFKDGIKRTFLKEDCDFGYRDSVFKRMERGQFLITSVTLKLSRIHHQLNVAYGAIQRVLEENAVHDPTIKDIAEAVIHIRQSKLPDPRLIGNAGSFFKNPIVTQDQFSEIYSAFPQVPHYPVDENAIKLPAGWLIDQCGWKGKRIGDAGCYEKQALVLVNHGKATGKEIWNLAQQIQASVQTKFNILLEPEVNVM